MCTFSYHYPKKPTVVLSTLQWSVTLLSRTFLVSDLGLWATPNHDCFQMWKFDSLVPVVLSHQPAHPHHYSERQKRRESLEKPAQVLQSQPSTTAYAVYQLFISLVSISSPVKCDNDWHHKLLFKVNTHLGVREAAPSQEKGVGRRCNNI